jgi:hypothetical protein
MRTSQTTCSCPHCHERAILTLTEFLTGDRAGTHEFSYVCPTGCKLPDDAYLDLWADARCRSA